MTRLTVSHSTGKAHGLPGFESVVSAATQEVEAALPDSAFADLSFNHASLFIQLGKRTDLYPKIIDSLPD